MTGQHTRTARPLRAGALFAGYGGLELGLSQVLDVETAWVAEVERAPSRILAARFPGVPNLGDVTRVDWSAVEPVDVISGGSPCQDLSGAGKMAGMMPGTRSGLWASMCDAIAIIRPRLVVWENVRGALSAPATTGHLERCEFCLGDDRDDPMRALGRVLGDLADLGYDAAWQGVRASDVGAPHGRFRVFVVAWPADSPDLRHERGGVHGTGGPDLRTVIASLPHTDSTTGSERRLAAPRQAESGRPRADARGRGGAPAAEVTLLPTPAVNDMESWEAWTARMKSAHGNGNGHGNSLHIEALRMLPTPRATDGTKGGPNQRGSSGDLMLPSAVLLMPTPTATQRGTDQRADARPTAGENLHNAALDFGRYTPAVARWEQVLGRPAPAPAEPTGKGGAYRLSPRFVEWMMGLPDGWVTGRDVELSRNEALKALGNGVVPHQAAAAVRRLLDLREWVLQQP